jgi:hypothetical protein
MAHRVKGSMLYMDDGESIFTPYNSKPENVIWETIGYVTEGIDIRKSKSKIQFRVTLPLSVGRKMMGRKIVDKFTKLLVIFTTKSDQI